VGTPYTPVGMRGGYPVYTTRVCSPVYTTRVCSPVYTPGYTQHAPVLTSVRAASPAHAEVPDDEALGSRGEKGLGESLPES